METKKLNIKRIFITIIFVISTFSILNNTSFANTEEYTKKIVARAGLSNIEGYIELEINKNGKIYEYESFKEENNESEKKTQKYTTETKEFLSKTKDFLDEQFEDTIDYEDEKYIGQLQLTTYNIETIDNGYSERIDSKEIVLQNLPTNDLSQVEKKKRIDGRDYVLVNVNWESEENQEIDNTLVPIVYKGTAIYQCVIRTNNPSTYKVSANYMGEVEEKEKLSDYIITYKLKEQPIIEPEVKENTVNIKPIVVITGGIIVLGIIAFLLKPNATIYNIQNGNNLVKISSIRLKNGQVIDITDKQDKISGNRFILQLNNSDLEKFSKLTVAIKLNGQNKQVTITSVKNYFSF